MDMGTTKGEAASKPLLYYELHEETDKKRVNYYTNLILLSFALVCCGLLLLHFHQKETLPQITGLGEVGVGISETNLKMDTDWEQEVGGNSFAQECTKQDGVNRNGACYFSTNTNRKELKIQKCEGVPKMEGNKGNDMLSFVGGGGSAMLAGASAMTDNDFVIPNSYQKMGKTGEMVTKMSKLGMYASGGLAFSSVALPMVMDMAGLGGDPTAQKLEAMEESIDKLAECVNGNFEAINAEFKEVWSSIKSVENFLTNDFGTKIDNFSKNVKDILDSFSTFFIRCARNGEYTAFAIRTFEKAETGKYAQMRGVFSGLSLFWDKTDDILKQIKGSSRSSEDKLKDGKLILNMMWTVTEEVNELWNEYNSIALARGVYLLEDAGNDQKKMLQSWLPGIIRKIKEIIRNHGKNWLTDGKGCQNTDTRKDRYGKTCSEYFTKKYLEWNPKPCGRYVNQPDRCCGRGDYYSFKSSEQCCECGGGTHYPHPPLQRSLEIVEGTYKEHQDFMKRRDEGIKHFSKKYDVTVGYKDDYLPCSLTLKVKSDPNFTKKRWTEGGYRKTMYPAKLLSTYHLDIELKRAVKDIGVSPYLVCNVGRTDSQRDNRNYYPSYDGRGHGRYGR